ncbi:multiple epidermal growth factor-like domains protein 6 isoform X3 [Mizuhopecten yessoensis]|uniref:multiple epidermal growth factor-like domains protein 6 isoform X3 n=1 Tax=Mizuhopecten yessoensis TaxID=6573 RepID=UPI000B459E34|nr:multiple epidermal growth factor-like domains protein 6 isoform X3 [Mizuhopecten yessoensis]
MDIPVLWLLFGLACYVGYAQGVCPSGQWGDTCQNTCSAQCFTSTPCRETTSVCGCQQTTGRCQTCNQGYFGENCTFPCSDSCTVGCNRANGECANVGDCSNCLNGENSCVSGKCTACKHQMFGETCDTACSFCDRGCEQDNGQCYPEFCANCEGGVANCDTTNFVCVGTCISGTYGNDCQQTCAQFSGISNCITCIETTDPMTCGACSEGYYSAVTSCSPCSDGCVSNSCAATDGSCLQGCISGRGGRMCDQFKCEVSNCATCQTNQHLQCLTCNSGYYLTSPACTRCHENCISRSCDVTSGRCSFGCVDGWYGDKCENKCGNCSGIACDRDVGSCIGSCVPGYTGSSCKDQCSSKCLLSCDKFTGTCNACPNGKYGETCDYQCTSTCNDISCEQLTGNCIATCQTGYYGAQCSTPCSTNCVSSVCDKIGGRCTIGCNSGYHGDLCLDQCPVRCFPRTCFRSTGQCSNACIQSFHGAFCNETCSSSCEGGTCQKSSGYCSQGCKSGFWGNTCADQCATGCAARCVQTLGVCLAEDGCRDGFFGNYCNITCNDRCADNKCLQTNGDCEGRCVAGYYGLFCNNECKTCAGGLCNRDTGKCDGQCLNGYHGDSCLFNCSTQCFGSLCDKTTAKCQGSCVFGYHGDYCDRTCSQTCATGGCVKLTGECLGGCTQGYYGSYCNMTCADVTGQPQCVTCLASNTGYTCSQCSYGFYADGTCKLCNLGCLSSECYGNNGTCTSGCNVGRTGAKCDEICSNNCAGAVCEIDGVCKFACVSGYYGTYCNQTCGKCTSGTCGRTDGTCNVSCLNGFYGIQCKDICSTSCSSRICNQNSGKCLACPDGTWGFSCEHQCNRCDGPCDQDTGVCRGVCIGNTHHGDYCNVTCSSTCVNNNCQKADGRCSGTTCVDGYFGDFCSSGCETNCRDGRCDKTTGHCEGECAIGFHGDFCTSACPSQCLDLLCSRFTGVCVRGCVPGYRGDQCSSTCSSQCGDNTCNQHTGACEGTCVNGYFGPFCNISCSNCLDGRCGKTDGTCLGLCRSGFHGDKCLTQCTNACVGPICEKLSGKCLGACQNGFYGNFCNISCSTNCLNGICIKSSGVCGSGTCATGFYGSYCNMTCVDVTGDVRCTQCQGVSNNYYCIDCSTGYYADNTCKLCSAGCLNGQCFGNNGTCESGCITGKRGLMCDADCSTSCQDNKCSVSGVCTVGCVVGKYGAYCDQNCGGCTSGRCDITTGNCDSPCVTGYHGGQCKDVCSGSCKDSICNKADGRCGNCNAGKWGFYCQFTCPNCAAGICYQDTGACLGLCADTSFYGSHCNESCSNLCADNRCQKDDGRCIGACIGGYWGEDCFTRCDLNCKTGMCQKANGYCSVVTKPDGTKNLPLIIGLSVAGGILIPFSIAIICCCQRSHGQDQATLVNGNVALVANGDSKEYIGGLDNISSRSFTGSKYGQVGEQISIHAPLGHLTHRSADAHSGSHVSSSYNTSFNPTPHLTGSHLGVSHLSADRIVMSSFVLLDGTKGVKVEDFSAFMTQMKMSDRGFEMELATLHQGLQHPHAAAMRPENRAKNRYKDVYPYDHSRVILNADDGDYTDYINASYIDGYQSPKAYIACQGPTENMVNDFWRMIWQLNCQTIIMVTNLVEGGVTKCMQYWPEEGEEVVYGEFTIACDDVERYTDFRISNLNVSSNGEMKTLRHAQFLSWPDKEVPKYVTPLVEFHDKVKSSDTPCVVHCSAGVGRSGTYIAMDYLLEQADTQGSVNVHECVAKMRDSRVNMIQTAGQYQFLHVVLEAALKNRDTTVSVEEFSQYYNVLRRDSDSHSHLHRQFENLTCPTEMEYEAAHMPENLPKNRNANILPPDDCRVYLWSRMKGCNDYINAVYLPTFKEKYAFIATEFPQNRTVVDFCRLVYQEECRTIVMMNNTFSGDKKHENYWGGLNQQMGCGPFQIKVTREEVKDGYKVLTMEFRFDVEALAGDLGAEDKGSVQLRQYQYSGWEEGRLLPSNLDALLNMIDDIRDWNASSSAKGKPLIVHCMDGAERSGLFCVMAAAVERLRAEENVSMVHTINQMRVRRPQVIPNIEQFRYCHEAILQYIEHHYNNGDIIL